MQITFSLQPSPGVRLAICCEFFRNLGLGFSRTSISVGC